MDRYCHFMSNPSDCDWAITGSMLSGIGQITSTAATAVGAYAVFWAAQKAANTYHSWRIQKVTERRIEKAEQIMLAVYKAQSALNRIRREPSLAELNYATDELKQRDGKEASLDHSWVQAYSNRLSAEQSHFDQLREQLPNVKTYFSHTELEDHISYFSQQFDLLGLSNYMSLKADGDSKISYNRELYSASSFSKNNTRDPFDEKVRGIVQKIEDICLSDIRASSAITL